MEESAQPVNKNSPENSPTQQKQEPEKDLFSWTAPARPFKRRNREFYVTVIAIATVCGLVLFLVDGWLPVMLIIALVFLFYVLSTVEPENVDYKITSYGIKIAGNLTPWSSMNRFWFTKRFDSELLAIETITLPGRLELVINPQSEDEIEKSMKDHLKLEEAPPSFLDKSADWFSKKLPQN